jgi:hypothetical protein
METYIVRYYTPSAPAGQSPDGYKFYGQSTVVEEQVHQVVCGSFADAQNELALRNVAYYRQSGLRTHKPHIVRA